MSTDPQSSSSPSASTSSGQPTQASAFEQWRRRAMLITGLGVTEEERMKDLQQINLKRCEKMKQDLMDSSPIVVFMLKHLRLSGCQVPEANIFCGTCEMKPVAGGGVVANAGSFIPEPGAVKLCAGHFFNKKHMEHTIVHELTHLYDQCKFKVDWSNLRHHACSEIRANNLSGDCRYTRELRRGIVSFTKQHQVCASVIQNNSYSRNHHLGLRS
ncbi:Mitochondrial inner membrane protease atp23 [Marasmius tenuissimus]|uniref:Mitochondrial inner membrane protease ATP23 n=1 Tax=Marasmius tenuissimus TaxID=585030 RepID=A0ABR2ZL41_9AGAR